MNSSNKRSNTLSEKKILESFKKTLIVYSDSRGAPDHLKKIIKEVISRLDNFLKSEKNKKRLRTLNSLIEIINKIILLLKMIF